MSESIQPAPTRQAKGLDERPPSFGDWAISTVDKLWKAVGLGAILVTAGSILSLHPERWIAIYQEDPTKLDAFLTQTVSHERATLAFIQAAACLLLAILIPSPKPRPRVRSRTLDERQQTAQREQSEKKACERIQHLLVWLYFGFSVYYIVTGFQLLSHDLSQPDLNNVFLMILNAFQGLLFFWLYLELAELTVDVPVPRARKQQWVSGTIFVFVVVLSLGCLAEKPIFHSEMTSACLTILDVIAACLTAVSLALVVGRLGHQRIDPGALVLGFLYFYAVIQPVAVSFAEKPVLQVLATTVALPLKVLLWLVCVWAFTTGVLAEYVHTLRPLLQRQEAGR